MALNKTAFGLLSAAISLCTVDAAFAQAPSYSLDYSLGGAYTGLAASGDLAAARNGSTVDIFLQGPGGWAPMTSFAGYKQTGPYFSDNDVALSGDTLIVGRVKAAQTDIWLREGSNWIGEESLFSPDSTTTTSFGESVALIGDTALIGDPSLGRVYIYQRTDNATWFLSQELDQPTIHGFGYRMSTDGRNLLVSGDGDSVVAYVLNNGSWELQQTLTSTSFIAPTLSVVDGVSLFNDVGTVPVSVFAQSGDTWGLDQSVDNGNSRYAAMVSPTRFIASSLATGLVTIFDRDDTSWSNTGSLAPPTCSNDNCSFGIAMQVGAAYFMASAPGVAGPTNVPFLYIYHDDNAQGVSTILEADNNNPAYGTPTTFTALVFGDGLTGSVIFRAPYGHINGCGAVPVIDQGGGLSTATCTLTLPGGPFPVTAEYLGDGTHPTNYSDPTCVSVGAPDRIFADNFEGGACTP